MTHEQRIEKTKQELYYLIARYSLNNVERNEPFDDLIWRLMGVMKSLYLALDELDMSDEDLDKIGNIMKRYGLLDDEFINYMDLLTEDQQKKLIEHVENYIRE